MSTKQQQRLHKTKIVAIVGIIILVGIGGYLLGTRNSKQPPTGNQPALTKLGQPDQTVNWKT